MIFIRIKLRTIERIRVFGQMILIGYVIALIVLLLAQKLSVENALIALAVDTFIMWAIMLFLGDYR